MMGGISTPTKLPTAKQFLAMAASQIGTLEGRDDSGNWNNNTKYGVWYGMNRVAWCGIFVSWVAAQVGALDTLVPKYASCWHGLKWFRDRKQTGYWPPQPGDIFILREYHPGVWNADADGWATVHTGIVEKYLGNGRIQTIEGNTNNSGSAQGNGVYRLIRQDSETGKRFVYCRPKWAPEPPPPPAPVKPVVSKPVVKPAPKPIPGAIYKGSYKIDVSMVRPGYRNESVRRFNGILWAWLCKNSPDYARKNSALWMKESSNLYGKQAQRATQEMYRVLTSRHPKIFKPVTLPTWPGKDGVKFIGGQPY
jgi:hypothetical protein